MTETITAKPGKLRERKTEVVIDLEDHVIWAKDDESLAPFQVFAIRVIDSTSPSGGHIDIDAWNPFGGRANWSSTTLPDEVKKIVLAYYPEASRYEGMA